MRACRYRRNSRQIIWLAVSWRRKLAHDPEDQVTARHVPRTVECVAVLCATRCCGRFIGDQDIPHSENQEIPLWGQFIRHVGAEKT